MSSQRKQFPFPEFEPAWQKRWLETGAFRAANPGDADFDAAKPKYYVLDMFPYPSGEGLHVGHVEGYTATDIIARFKRMQGFNVLHPMGWDAFGLPAEQFAIKTGQHPRVTTERNIARFKTQLRGIGFSYDWDREISTTDPGYFKWTQWIFRKLYHSWFNPVTQKAEPIETYAGNDPDGVRLAFVSEVPVNWCPELGTVLANEEVVEGKSEVGGFPVERRPLRQWMLRITAYAERLIDELDGLDWPESIKLLQRNWIGKSQGAMVEFSICGEMGPPHPHQDFEPSEARQTAEGSPKGELASQFSIEVFTTRPDTLFGATYMVLAPEHMLVPKITTVEQRAAVEVYQKQVGSKSDLERTDLAKDKTGVFTGAYAINPVNGERIPIWIADYVLMGYGTGAIMAVPAHDERDFEFARKFGLEIRPVVQPASGIGFQPMRSFDKVEIREGANLPHWTQEKATYSATFRLADSLPESALAELSEDRRYLIAKAGRGEPLSSAEAAEWRKLFTEKIESLLDAGHGDCPLGKPEIATLVENALKHFDGERYDLLAWCVMPNHVHVVFTPIGDHSLSGILHSWKSFTANKANEALGRTGEFWQRESYDHLIRNSEEFSRQVQYALANPEKAGLRDWKWAGRKETHRQDADATEVMDCYAGEGTAVNSQFLDGLPTAEAKQRITAWLEEKGIGRGTVNYKLRDWLFSRQRYWGEPFPIVWENGRHRSVDETELPVLPPEMDDFKPTGTPEPPLSKVKEWLHYSEAATRETNTMPQWAGSCWYYLRFCDAENPNRFVGEEAERYWMGANPKSQGVDLYVGGTEHAVLHLLYARFWHKALFDLGCVSTREPFHKLVNQGIILGPDNQKMSKSRGNVVNPEQVIVEFGADSLRLYEMFMGPLEQMKPWSDKGVEGVYRFLARVWRLAMEETQEGGWVLAPELAELELTPAQLRVAHATIKKVTEDIQAFAFNTAIAQMMVFTNEFVNANPRPRAALRILLPLLSPFAPHLAEELWERLEFEGRASAQPWPVHDPRLLIVDEVEYVVQVNGKVRDRLTVKKDAADAEIETLARASEKVKEFTAGGAVVKVIIVRGKLVNLVVRSN
ncbi:MAG TPA: class I tRNA ligase family protein [Chthoniobacterales bacterium]